MREIIRFLAGLGAALLSLCCPMAAMADTAETSSVSGSITVTVSDYETKNVLYGQHVGIAKIADISDEKTLVWNKDYASLEQEEITSSLAKDLAEYIEEENLAPLAEDTTGVLGTIEFSNLSEGLYLIYETEELSGYTAMEPFLVSIPMEENGVLIYDIKAEPKGGLEKKEVPSSVLTDLNIPDTDVPVSDTVVSLSTPAQQETQSLSYRLKTGVESNIALLLGIVLCFGVILVFSVRRRKMT